MRIKKIAAIIFAVLILLGSSLWAYDPEEWADYSTVKTADALIVTGQGWFYGIMCLTDGTNSVTFDVYDNTSGSGTKLFPSVIYLINTIFYHSGFASPHRSLMANMLLNNYDTERIPY